MSTPDRSQADALPNCIFRDMPCVVEHCSPPDCFRVKNDTVTPDELRIIEARMAALASRQVSMDPETATIVGDNLWELYSRAAPPAPATVQGEHPPLPEPRIVSYQTDSVMRATELRTYDGADMHAYADAAVAADRAQRHTALPAEISEAAEECRDAILNGRYGLESVLDGDQTNAVLGVFDDTIGNALARLLAVQQTSPPRERPTYDPMPSFPYAYDDLRDAAERGDAGRLTVIANSVAMWLRSVLPIVRADRETRND